MPIISKRKQCIINAFKGIQHSYNILLKHICKSFLVLACLRQFTKTFINVRFGISTDSVSLVQQNFQAPECLILLESITFPKMSF